MEQNSYLVWKKRKHPSTTSSPVLGRTNPSCGDYSWEEQAFAEDAAGVLGAGCIWPPRSYTCSFCGREFRSAQALGGHMNIHRRDRARLKQSPSPQKEESLTNQTNNNHVVPNHCPLLDDDVRHLYKPQIYTLTCNPNSDYYSGHGALAPSLSPFASSIVQQSQKKTSTPPSSIWSNFLAEKNSESLSSAFNNEDKNGKVLDYSSFNKGMGDNNITADLSVRLNFFICGTDHSKEEGEEGTSSKRRRTDPTVLLPFFPKSSSSSIGRHHLQSEIYELRRPNLVEDLDLELRLGERPKVK